MATASKTSPIGVLSFPHLFVPKAATPGAEERYSCVLIFDENAQNTPEFKAMKKAVLEAAQEKWGTKADDMIKRGALRLPFRDASEKSQYGGYDEGKVFISAWTKQKPDVIDGRLNDVVPSDVFPGCLARITYTCFAYENSGNRGVSFGLNNVQIADFTTERLDNKKKGRDDFDTLDSQHDEEMEDDEMPFLIGGGWVPEGA